MSIIQYIFHNYDSYTLSFTIRVLNMLRGPLFIMIAASLWAIDALIRTPLTQHLSPVSIVFWEHVIGLFVLSPFLIPVLKKLPSLRSVDWGWFVLLSLVSSVGGTILFTQALSSSFASGDFITPLLLQKLQPLIVISLSWLLLKERIHKQFLLFALLALIGGYLMSFGLFVPSFSFAGKELVVLFSLSAASCWALGTIISKTVLQRFTVIESTSIRFILTIPLTFLISFIISSPVTGISSSVDLGRFFFIALTTGTAALGIYYVGLKKTPAHIATIAELMFPLVSILIGITALNPYGAAQTLSLPQLIGIVLLLIGVVKSTRTS